MIIKRKVQAIPEEGNDGSSSFDTVKHNTSVVLCQTEECQQLTLRYSRLAFV